MDTLHDGLETRTPLAVLGTGRMGRAMAGLATRVGYDVRLGSRDVGRARTLARDAHPRMSGGSYSWATSDADFVVLATDWERVAAVLNEVELRRGAVLLDVTNPEIPSHPGLVVGVTTSGAEEVARRAPQAHVVKAFNHIYAEVLEQGDPSEDDPAAVFVCGNHPGAKRRVAALVRAAGLRPIDLGPLASARFTEPASQLIRQLVRGMEWDPLAALLRFGNPVAAFADD